MCSSNLKVGFGSFSCICVWKTVEYFNQYSYRNWHGVDLSDSRNSLRTDRMVDLLLHAQWRGRQSLLPCMAGCLAADGWPSNKPNYFWFCMKLISMQGCWVSVWISNGFSLFSLSLSLFLFSLLLAMKTPRQMSIIFQVSVTFAELKGCSARSGGGQLPGAEITSCLLRVFSTNSHTGHHGVWIARSLIKGEFHNSKGHKLFRD